MDLGMRIHLVTVVGESAHWLPHMLAHYRGLGIESFLIHAHLSRPDDPVGLLRTVILHKMHGAAELDDTRCGRSSDQAMVADDLLELLDSAFDEALLVLGGVILEVLREVPMLPCGLDLFDDVWASNRGQLGEFGANCKQTLWSYVNIRRHKVSLRSPLVLMLCAQSARPS